MQSAEWSGVSPLAGVHVRTVLDKEFAETPVSVEAGGVQIEVMTERGQIGTARKKKPDGADVAVIGAPAEERDAVGILFVWRTAGIEQLEYKVCAPIDQFAEQHVDVFCHGVLRRGNHQARDCRFYLLTTPR